MSTFKQKIKNFWEEHGEAIIGFAEGFMIGSALFAEGYLVGKTICKGQLAHDIMKMTITGDEVPYEIGDCKFALKAIKKD